MYKVLLLALLSPALAIGQAVVNTNEPRFAPRWEEIPAPTAKPTIATLIGNFPHRAGTYEVAYTLVDNQDRHSERSPPVKVITDRHFNLVVNPVGLALDCPAVATCWWFNDNGVWRILGGPVFCNHPIYVTRPYFPLTGWQYHRYQGHRVDLTIRGEWDFIKYAWPAWESTQWKKGGLPKPVYAPQVRVLYPPPIDELQMCYTWATSDGGESPASPIVSIPKASGARDAIEIERGQVPPMGACGCYVYLRRLNGPWHRQPVLHVTNPVSLDGWLYRLDANVIHIGHYYESGIAPSPIKGKSYLSSLHLAIRDMPSHSPCHICVTENQIIQCPIIMPLTNAHGNNQGRTISGPLGGQWGLIAKADAGKPSAWPVFIDNSHRTRLVGASISSATAVVGIAFADFANGGAMHFDGQRLGIFLQANNAVGICCVQESRWAANGHSASEPFFRNININCKFPVMVEWNQSAQWQFDNVNAYCNGAYDSAVFTLGNSGMLTVKGRLSCEEGRAIFAITSGNNIEADNVFTDTGFPEWFVCSYRTAPVVRAGSKSVHLRHKFLNFITQTSPNEHLVDMRFDCMGSEGTENVDISNFTTRFNGIQLKTDNIGAMKALVVKQPTLQEWQQTRYWQSWDKGQIPAQPGQITKPATLPLPLP